MLYPAELRGLACLVNALDRIRVQAWEPRSLSGHHWGIKTRRTPGAVAGTGTLYHPTRRPRKELRCPGDARQRYRGSNSSAAGRSRPALSSCRLSRTLTLFLLCFPPPLSSRDARHPSLRPATRDELTQSLSFALRFDGRKRVHDADEVMARITAERLVEHLEQSGYVIMCKPPLGQHGEPGNLAGWIEKATKMDRSE